jgi:hypothetical protein
MPYAGSMALSDIVEKTDTLVHRVQPMQQGRAASRGNPDQAAWDEIHSAVAATRPFSGLPEARISHPARSLRHALPTVARTVSTEANNYPTSL